MPEHPVISPVSGCIYERRLLEKYIAENASDPMNGEKLSMDMLIDVKSKLLNDFPVYYSSLVTNQCKKLMVEKNKILSV